MPDTAKLLKQSNANFKRYTGIEKATFEQMLEAMQEYEVNKTKSGRPSALSLEDQILLALTYWREYRTLYHIGMDFGVYESSASRIVRKVENVLIDSGRFELSKKLPSRTDEDNVNWTSLIVDATETPIEPPKKNQKQYYSGKQKQHTLKAQIIVHWQTGMILDVQTCKGSVHDFKLYKDTCPDWFENSTCIMADSGYQGIAHLHKKTFIPFKKPKGGSLITEAKQANQYLAKFRILVEHKIGLMKLFKIVSERYRNRRQRYDLRMSLFAGIVNFENTF